MCAKYIVAYGRQVIAGEEQLLRQARHSRLASTRGRISRCEDIAECRVGAVLKTESLSVAEDLGLGHRQEQPRCMRARSRVQGPAQPSVTTRTYKTPFSDESDPLRRIILKTVSGTTPGARKEENLLGREAEYSHFAPSELGVGTFNL